MIEVIIVLLIAGAAAVGQTYFIYRYLRYSVWNTTSVGRALMVKSASLALLLNIEFLSVIFYLYNRNAGIIADALSTLAYIIVTLAIWWQLIVLVKTQNKRPDNMLQSRYEHEKAEEDLKRQD